jgi:hypothetical protein
MEYILSNISSFNLANITNSVYIFSNIVSGDPYRVVAEVYDTLYFQHILTDVKLGDANAEYFWPTDDVSGLDFTLETEAAGIQYTIDSSIIRSDEIPFYIYTNVTQPSVQGYQLQYDLYAEPVTRETYQPHSKMKYITTVITTLSNVDGPFLTRYVMSDLDTLVGYNIYYSLKVKPPNDDWYYLRAHTLFAENVVTIDPGFVVQVLPIDLSSTESIQFTRTATDHYINRFLVYHIQEYSVEEYIT